jgi:hypothetical protein
MEERILIPSTMYSTGITCAIDCKEGDRAEILSVFPRSVTP